MSSNFERCDSENCKTSLILIEDPSGRYQIGFCFGVLLIYTGLNNFTPSFNTKKTGKSLFELSKQSSNNIAAVVRLSIFDH